MASEVTIAREASISVENLVREQRSQSLSKALPAINGAVSSIESSLSRGDGNAVGLNARYYTNYVKNLSRRNGTSSSSGVRYVGDYLSFTVGDRNYELGVDVNSRDHIQLSDSTGAFLGRHRLDDKNLSRNVKESIVRLREAYERRNR